MSIITSGRNEWTKEGTKLDKTSGEAKNKKVKIQDPNNLIKCFNEIPIYSQDASDSPGHVFFRNCVPYEKGIMIKKYKINDKNGYKKSTKVVHLQNS